MRQVLTVKRADVANLFVNPEGNAVFPFDFNRENFEPFHIVGGTPKGFFDLETKMIERQQAETDTTNLQVIPYIVLVDAENENRIFSYVRGNKGNEERLKQKRSIGLGGHIDVAPNKWTNFAQTVAREAIRELNEETGIELSSEEQDNVLEGFIEGSSIVFTEADEVGTVHLGLCLLLRMSGSRLTKLEDGVIEGGKWMNFDELAAGVANEEFELEHWSNLVMMHIQSFSQPKPHPVANDLNTEMNNVHLAFNKIFQFCSATNTDIAQISAWQKFKEVVQELNIELDKLVLPSLAANEATIETVAENSEA